jgi:nitrogen fixation/metabolism regulation signal transduction histidine kinase
MSTTVQSAAPNPNAGRAQRSVKNYLLDPGFQLKYSGYLVAVTMVLSVTLGSLLWRTSDAAIAQSRTAVTQAQEAVQAGQGLIKKSQDLSNVVKMNIAEKYADQPDLAKLFNDEAKKEDVALAERQKHFEAEAARLATQGAALEHQQRTIMITLIATLATLVVFIGIAGIIVTHKIAGPIFKMKRQIRELGEGKLQMPGKLRKGDELVHFFETFEDTVRSLRDRQAVEIKKVDAIISDLEKSGTSASTLASLKSLRGEMQAELD